jgi:peptidyl-prolyl cis-trans isomerase SurA
MMKKGYSNRLGWLLTIITISAGLMLSFSLGTGLTLTDRIIAIVNNEVITQSDLDQEVQDEYLRLKAKYQGSELERHYHQKQREVLNALIDDRLLLQEAKAKGLSVTQEEIDAALRRTPLPPTQTEEEFGRQMLLKKLFDYEVRRNILVEEEEARRYYESNISVFHKPPRYRLKQILLPGKDEFDRERARKKAQRMYTAWTPDVGLAEFASRHVEEITPLGWVQEDELLPPLGQVIKELKPGQLSPPLETHLGFHFLMVEEIQQPEPYPYEDVKQDIHTLLMRKRSEEAYRNWLVELKQKAFIEVKF